MKTILLVMGAALALPVMGETEIQLVTGSRFKGTVKKLTPRFVVVDTAIGELKLTREMLSHACRRSLKAGATEPQSGEKPDVHVKVKFREKTIAREKDTHRRGRKREFKQKAGVLTVEFDALPQGKSYSGRVEYVFTGENRSLRQRGKLVQLDRGVKHFEFQANERDPKVEIMSKPVSHVETSHTGDKLREGGVELKGYRVKVYLNGHLVHEEEK